MGTVTLKTRCKLVLVPILVSNSLAAITNYCPRSGPTWFSLIFNAPHPCGCECTYYWKGWYFQSIALQISIIKIHNARNLFYSQPFSLSVHVSSTDSIMTRGHYVCNNFKKLWSCTGYTGRHTHTKIISLGWIAYSNSCMHSLIPC